MYIDIHKQEYIHILTSFKFYHINLYLFLLASLSHTFSCKQCPCASYVMVSVQTERYVQGSYSRWRTWLTCKDLGLTQSEKQRKETGEEGERPNSPCEVCSFFCNALLSQECVKFVDTVEVQTGLGVL